MIISKLKQINGYDASFFDRAVLRKAQEVAQEINYSGLEAQIEYLTEVGYTEEKIWELLLKESLHEGMEIDVAEPTLYDDEHKCSFSGVVVKVLDHYIIAKDHNNDELKISYRAVEDFEYQ